MEKLGMLYEINSKYVIVCTSIDMKELIGTY